MRILYDIFLFLFNAAIGIAAFFGNQKAGQWIEGRKNWENKIKDSLNNAGKNRVWFHCASLGEFEQGRPLIEKLKMDEPEVFIVLSFFSPSGFELRKNFPLADVVCYLPRDTKKNAERFISLISPSYAVFIKYEFWLHYFEELHRKKIPLFIASAIFRNSQVFFKWYGSFYRKILKNVKYFFVQDVNSIELLKKSGFSNASVTGDTRFDRVRKIADERLQIPLIENFKGNNRLLIAGSTWPEDEEILLTALSGKTFSDLKIIIAPHEISVKRINGLIQRINKSFKDAGVIKYSSADNGGNASFLVIDNIGLLSSVYSYGSLAWIGGGFGKGIHNILEASAFGLPVIFGPNYGRFKEAVDLIEMGGAFTLNDSRQAINIFDRLLNNAGELNKSSAISSEYVNSRVGATGKILESISKMKNNSFANSIR